LPFIKIIPEGEKKVNEFMTLRAADGENYPVGISVHYGGGSVSYISGQIGSLNEEDEKTYNEEWTFEWNQTAYEFQKVLFDQLFCNGSSFKPIDISSKVFVTVYKQPAGDKRYTLVHLLNATGSNMHKGEVVPKGVKDNAFPELTKDIKFRVKTSGVKDAYVASPDFPGHKSVTIRLLENGWSEVTVPKQYLKCYSIVWIEN
jgi:enamine deaminase RidA (YjgF/YER057c/UK114 family)